MSIIIEIYKSDNSNNPTLAASFTNDEDRLFSTNLFQKALDHFENTEGDPFHVSLTQLTKLQIIKKDYNTKSKIYRVILTRK